VPPPHTVRPAAKYMSDTHVLRAVCRKSTSLATARCASAVTTSGADGVSSADATLGVAGGGGAAAAADVRACRRPPPNDRRGGPADAGAIPNASSSSSSAQKSHVHAAGGGADAGPAGGGRTTATISASSASRGTAAGRGGSADGPAAAAVAVDARPKSINTESVEHDGDGAAGDQAAPPVRARRAAGAPHAPVGSCSDGAGGGGVRRRGADGGDTGGDAAVGGWPSEETDEAEDQLEGERSDEITLSQGAEAEKTPPRAAGGCANMLGGGRAGRLATGSACRRRWRRVGAKEARSVSVGGVPAE